MAVRFSGLSVPRGMSCLTSYIKIEPEKMDLEQNRTSENVFRFNISKTGPQKMDLDSLAEHYTPPLLFVSSPVPHLMARPCVWPAP